jgi:hypothetical protein
VSVPGAALPEPQRSRGLPRRLDAGRTGLGGNDAGLGVGNSSPTRGTKALQEVWKRTRDRPDRVIDETISELRRRLGLADHEPFTLTAYNFQVMRAIPRHRTLKKTLTILAQLFDMGYGDGVGQTLEGARLLAHILQSSNVTENAALSNGVFADWELLPFPDPEGVGRSLALPAERAALAARRREEALLAQSAASSANINARRAAADPGDHPAQERPLARRPKLQKGKDGGKGADAPAAGRGD